MGVLFNRGPTSGHTVFKLKLFRSAASSKLSSEDFTTELKSSLLFQKECLAVLREVWQNEGPALLALPKTALSVGEVKDLIN